MFEALRTSIANMIARQFSELTGTHALNVETLSFASLRDLPIPIQSASFCGIFLHIETRTFCPHTADRLS